LEETRETEVVGKETTGERKNDTVEEGDTPNLPLRDAILDKVMRRIGILNSYCYGPAVKEGLK